MSNEIPESVLHEILAGMAVQTGQKIRARRLAKRMLQGELAMKTGIAQPHLSNIEKGKRGMTLEVLATIAIILGCQVADLVPVLPIPKRVA